MAVDDTVENTDPQQPGNGNPEATPATEPAPIVADTQQEKVDKAEFDRVQNELNKARQRENQLINQRKKEQEDALAEQGKYRELYEAQLAEKQAAEEQANLTKLRNSAIEEYDNPRVKEAAQKLIDSNPSALFWANASDEADAKAQVKKQLDALASVVGSQEPQNNDSTTPPVNGNNPLPVENNQAAEEPSDIKARIERLKAFEKKYAGQPLV